MPRPTTLPSPWLELSEKLGGVSALATTLGVRPNTVFYWARRQRRPNGAAWAYIEHVFAANGIEPPVR